jgi:hypothetical protein
MKVLITTELWKCAKTIFIRPQKLWNDKSSLNVKNTIGPTYIVSSQIRSSYILAISEGGNIIEGTPEFTPGLSGVRVTWSLVLCVMFMQNISYKKEKNTVYPDYKAPP